MDIGVFAAPGTIAGTGQLFTDAEAAGLDSVWLLQDFGPDALLLIAALARSTTRIRVGTGVLPMFPRHPVSMAQSALTANLLLEGRFVLGVGPSHRRVVERSWGMSFDRPVRYAREYLEALSQALTQRVRYEGDVVTARADLSIDEGPVPTIILSAIGPQIVRLAGSHAAGTITWMTGPRTLASSLVPALRESALDSGRPEPEVIVPVPVSVTGDQAAARECAEQTYAWYGTVPSYQAALAREGLTTPGQMALIGTRDQVLEGMARYAKAGATTFAASLFGPEGDRQSTWDLLADVARTRPI